MTSRLKAVCFVAALLVIIAASGAVASPLLTAEEMSMVKGGWQQWYCINANCGTDVACNGNDAGGCYPDSKDPCDNVTTEYDQIEHCAGTTPNGSPCSRTGEVAACGPAATCYCYDPPLQECCYCTTINPRMLYNYFPCL